MNTAIQLDNREFTNADWVNINPPVSKNPDGSTLSRLNDNEWSFKIKVLERYVTKTHDVSTIPSFLRGLIYATYFNDDSRYSHDKHPTIAGDLASVRSLVKVVGASDVEYFFSKSGLSAYLQEVHAGYAQTTLASHLLVYWKLSVTASLSSICEYPRFNIEKLANKHCAQDKKEPTQTLAMPISIASQIMGNALSLFYAAQDSLPAIVSMINEYGYVKREADAIDSALDPNSNGYHSNRFAKTKLSDVTRRHLSNTPIATLMDDNFHPRHVSKWLNRILYACYTLILAFTGMRKHELFRLYDDSFSSYEVDGLSYYTVTAQTSKLETGEDRTDQWVCSELCGPILSLIRSLKSASGVDGKSAVIVFQNVHQARIKDCSDFPKRHFENLIVNTTLDEDSYAEYCKLNRLATSLLEPGDEWPLANHQWRRTFATLAIRFDLATLPAIKRQFKHVSLQMTEWYANYARITQNEEVRIDHDLNRLLTDIQNDMSAEVLYDAYNTNEPLAGGKGDSIMVARESGRTPKVFSSKASIKALLERGREKLHYAGLNYCMNGYKCDQDGLVNAAFCTGCDFSLITPEIAKKWKTLHSRCVSHLEFAADCGDVSSVSFSHFISQIRAAERVMKKCNIQFTPFQEAP